MLTTLLAVLALIVGFVLLIKGADFFIDGATLIAKKFSIPEVIIGLTIVAFGTSAPEAAVSISAGLQGSNDIALGNCIGSNIFNLLIVAGFSMLFRPMKITKTIIKTDYPFSIIAAILLVLLSLDSFAGFSGNYSAGVLSRFDGLILLIVFAMYMYSLISTTLQNKKLLQEEKSEKIPSGKIFALKIILGFVGLAGIIFGGDIVVKSASYIARILGLSETIIGLTIVAMGTSLPELVTSIIAAKKNQNDIAIGNVVGSNIFNIFFVLGASATIHPITVGIFSIYDSIICIGVSLLFFIPMVKNKQVGRICGSLMILTYAAYTAYIFIR